MAVERESVNFKLPKSLVEALRAEAKKRNTSATELVVQGLHHILGETEVVENGIEDVLHRIINRLSALEANQVDNTSSLENRLQQIETLLEHLTQSIEQSIESTSPQQQSQQPNHLEEKLETVAKSLAQLNHTLGQLRPGNTSRRKFSSSHQFQGRPIELHSCTGESLARRLGVDEISLARERENKTPSEFESWSRHRDPGSRGWRFGDDGLYYPVK
ncbi:MAG: hypothetical protein KME59_20620 [Trichormus sp. ATA11-4-KO1]|jgi:exonuclease VII large subunit|nr:hypothetical protein [Trichormus sp. ATA11-4-KO1]